jgi:nucleoid-associated protein YgaU
MVSMAIGGAGGLVDSAAGIGIGVAAMSGAPIPAMLRCIDPTALGLVLFDFNPSEIKMDRSATTNTRPNSTGGSSNHILAKANQPTLTVNKITMVGEDTKMRVDTLLAWTAPPQGLITALVGLLGITSSTQPDLTFQWGPPMLGFMYTVQLKSVSATYKRFHSSGIPIRAEVNLTMNVKPSLLGSIPTNPTSGGQPGRTTHLVRENESLHSIAQLHYGRPGLWRKIAEINGITDPSRVRPGTTVFLPGPGELPAGSR